MAQAPPPPKVSTPRLNLRPPRAADAPLLARLVDDADIARMTTAIPHPYPHDAAEGFIERMSRVDGGRERLFAMEASDEGFVGLMGFHPNEAGYARWARALAEVIRLEGWSSTLAEAAR